MPTATTETVSLTAAIALDLRLEKSLRRWSQASQGSSVTGMTEATANMIINPRHRRMWSTPASTDSGVMATGSNMLLRKTSTSKPTKAFACGDSVKTPYITFCPNIRRL
jgi:hypothetical protein